MCGSIDFLKLYDLLSGSKQLSEGFQGLWYRAMLPVPKRQTLTTSTTISNETASCSPFMIGSPNFVNQISQRQEISSSAFFQPIQEPPTTEKRDLQRCITVEAILSNMTM